LFWGTGGFGPESSKYKPYKQPTTQRAKGAGWNGAQTAREKSVKEMYERNDARAANHRRLAAGLGLASSFSLLGGRAWRRQSERACYLIDSLGKIGIYSLVA
jgi:hypothetical protein